MKHLLTITLFSILALTASNCRDDSPELAMVKSFDLIIRNQNNENLIGTTYNTNEVFVIDNYGYGQGTIYYYVDLGYVIGDIPYEFRFDGEYRVILDGGDTDTLRFEYIDVPGAVNFFYNNEFITNILRKNWVNDNDDPLIIAVKK